MAVSLCGNLCSKGHKQPLITVEQDQWLYTGKSQLYSILRYPRNSCGKFKIFCKFQKIRNLYEILTVSCIFREYFKYSGVLRSHDLGLCKSRDLSAQEYLMYPQKMHGTVKISCRFLIFWNLQNILNFPQLFLGYPELNIFDFFLCICLFPSQPGPNFEPSLGPGYCAWCGYVCMRLPVQEGGQIAILPHFPGISLAGNLPQPSTFFHSIPGHSYRILWQVSNPILPLNWVTRPKCREMIG